MTPQDWDILAKHGVTPDNLSVAGWLDLSGAPITALPDNMSVSWSLYLSGAPITALPDNLSVGGSLDLRGTPITALLEDDRGYRLDRAGDRYIAGCRNFTAAEAIAHWGAVTYHDPQRGAAYVAAVKAEESRRAKNTTPRGEAR